MLCGDSVVERTARHSHCSFTLSLVREACLGEKEGVYGRYFGRWERGMVGAEGKRAGEERRDDLGEGGEERTAALG